MYPEIPGMSDDRRLLRIGVAVSCAGGGWGGAGPGDAGGREGEVGIFECVLTKYAEIEPQHVARDSGNSACILFTIG